MSNNISLQIFIRERIRDIALGYDIKRKECESRVMPQSAEVHAATARFLMESLDVHPLTKYPKRRSRKGTP